MVLSISPSQQLITGLTMTNSRCLSLHTATLSRDEESSCPPGQTLGPRTVTKYLSGLAKTLFARSLVTDPDSYISHIRRYSEFETWPSRAAKLAVFPNNCLYSSSFPTKFRAKSLIFKTDCCTSGIFTASQPTRR
jgi:hypothetical protein